MKKSFSFQIGENRISSLFSNETRLSTSGDIELGTLLSNTQQPVSKSPAQPQPQPKYNIVVWFGKYKIEFLDTSISVFLHICIMIIFEIYFYFNYVIFIEKDAFIDKINTYFNELSIPTPLFTYNIAVIHSEMDKLHENYVIAIKEQEQILHHLILVACKIGSGFWSLFFVFWVLGLFHFTQIKWKKIIIENVVMLVLLGLFEYLFFTNIIMNYNPISDAELEYIVAQKIYSLEYNTTRI